MTLSRRNFLLWSAAATVAACEPRLDASLSPRPTASAATPPATPRASATATVTAPSTAPTASAGRSGRTLFRDGALTDARSDRLQHGMSILVEDGTIRWIRPADGEPDPGPRDGLEVVDASGATFVPGMVDAHSHLTLPGGAHASSSVREGPFAANASAPHGESIATVNQPGVGRSASSTARSPTR